MREQTEQTRIAIGCGYLPQDPNAQPWAPVGRMECSDERDPKTLKLYLPVCPGYVCSLPEVIEASRAHFFLKNGGLQQFTGTEPPSEALLLSVQVIESEVNKIITHRQREAERRNKP